MARAEFETARGAAGRIRKARAAAGDRGQDALQDAVARNPQPVAAGNRQHFGREGLREGAGRRLRRRSRRAGRSLLAHALEQYCARRRRSGAAGRRRAAGALRAGAGAACPRFGADRRGRARGRPAAQRHAEDRPAAGLARRRSVALGRLRRRRPRADRRRTAAGAAQPLRRDRRRIGECPCRGRRETQALILAQAAFEARRPNAKAKTARASATSIAKPRGFRRWPKRAPA